MTSTVSRRLVLTGPIAACVGTPVLAQRVRPAGMQSLVGPGYRPDGVDEKGLWQQCDRFEQDLAKSNLLMNAPALKLYVEGVMKRLLAEQAADARVYLVHDATFNASMFPTGLMLVHTGFLARVRDEAQLAAVLGHECGHYLRRHSLQHWRDVKSKSAVAAFVGAVAGVGAGATMLAGGGYRNAHSWIDLANSVNTSLALSVLRFSREQEAEADAYGAKLMDAAGYPPEAAAQMWRQYIEERQASAAARHKKYRDRSVSIGSDHPPTTARMVDLGASAEELHAACPPDRHYDAGRAAWLMTVAPWRTVLLEEQVKLNDPGAGLYLVRTLAADGWDGTLRYFEGEVFRLRDEPGDAGLAATAYATAVTLPDAPAEAWRAHGYACLKAGRGDEGHRALAHYLEIKPDAPDVAMVRMSLT